MYNIFQFVLFTLFAIIALIRLQYDDFFLLPFINSLSFVVSLMMIFYSAYNKLNKLKQKDENLENYISKIFIFFISISVFGIGGFVFLAIKKLIASDIADTLSIIAFGISCSNDFFSNILTYKYRRY